MHPISSDKIRAKILDLGYGGDEKENEFHVTKNSKTNCVRGGLSSSALGKPAAADLRLGLATAPVLYASTEFPELETMIARYIETLCFLKSNGDLELRIDSISLRIQNI